MQAPAEHRTGYSWKHKSADIALVAKWRVDDVIHTLQGLAAGQAKLAALRATAALHKTLVAVETARRAGRRTLERSILSGGVITSGMPG